MTERILLNKLMKDKALKDVSCVVIDEAHERSVNIDFILAICEIPYG